MGSVGFEVEDELQPSTSNGKKSKSPRTPPDNGGAVSHGSVPKKLRSAINKRGRKSVAPQVPVSRKQYRVSSNGFETLRKERGKRSKLMKQGHITKDEEEVAETLYALADMFSDANRVDQPGLYNEAPEAKGSAVQEAGSSGNAVEDTGIVMTPQEEPSKKTTSNSSNLVDSAGKVVEFKSLGSGRQPELPTNKQPAVSSASGNQYESLDPRSKVSSIQTTSSGEQVIAMEKACKIEYDKNSHSVDDKNNGMLSIGQRLPLSFRGVFLSTNLSTFGALQSETQVSSPRPSINRQPESTNSASQPLSIKNRVTSGKYALAPAESKKSQKRCPAHVYISRLIKDLKVPERKERSLEEPIQAATHGNAGLQSHVQTHNHMTETIGRNGCRSFNGTTHLGVENESTKIQNGIPSLKRTLPDQQFSSETSVSCSSTYQGFDFISSLGAGVGSDPSKGINRARHEPPTQFHAPCVQSQSDAAIVFSPSQNGYSAAAFHGHNSSFTGQPFPHYPGGMSNSSFTARLGQQLDSQQQKWAAELPTRYNTSGVAALQLPDWKNGGKEPCSMLSYAHTLFPHLQSAVSSKYHQQFSHSQQQHLMVLNSTPLPLSNANRIHNHLPLGIDRNGAVFHQESIPQHFQLPCNQHLSN